MKNNIKSVYKYFLECPNVSTDTRKLLKGEMFFALKGPNYDANQLIDEALEKGAGYVITENRLPTNHPQIIEVEDSLKTLQQLANYHRQQTNAKVIAVTGSNGKTTTKELIAKVLSTQYPTIYTTGNLNNHIGVPLSVLQIQKDTAYAVIEMGANHLGEIRALCQIAEPDMGIITNIGKAHLEGFGSLTGVINAKSELYAYISDHNGMLFVNTDDPLLETLSKNIARFTYGNDLNADLYGQLIEADPYLHIAWEYSSFQMVTASRIIGSYNINNILAAIAVGCYTGVSAKLIDQVISDYEAANNRSQLIQSKHNRIILDAYNANPVSMEAAIRNFEQIRGARAIVILGDMLELGTESDSEHAAILKLLTDLELPEVILVGPHFEQVYAGDDWLIFNEVESVCNYLKDRTLKGYDILVKGSRAMQLEKVIRFL
ncbi:MAG: UDP-N-acetylmuramoyl-tripeptide--D-alanyl-D-alanine ligase [Bacteroidales bacterium]|nr:UDP-N-acetylmuramoyl-tripeptide--D-alanyl-D-alanine ligase [Bacteroidales bacterium]